MENISQFIITSGGYLHHIGMLTNNTGETLQALNRLPGLGEWNSGKSSWSEEEMIVGSANQMICSTARILDSILIEVIEPVEGKCDGTHFDEYLKKCGAGIHHICYGIPYYEDYRKIYEHLQKLGCRDVIHGRKCDDQGPVTDEFCYFEIKEEQMYLELCLTRYKWGYTG